MIDFPQQTAFVEDPSPRVGLVCDRRAGKTWGVLRKLLEAAEAAPGSACLYLTSRGMVQPSLHKLMEVARSLPSPDGRFAMDVKVSLGRTTVALMNGSTIALDTADADAAHRYEGRVFKTAAVDDAKRKSGLVLERFAPEQLVVAGSPGSDIFDVGEDLSWSTHAWALRDNPSFPYESWWKAHLARRGAA